ncbi:MAG: sulfotransferase family protein, partial [Chloroflexota bacterium]
MTLKVIGAGFGRTGTTSLKLALEQLGFDQCYHMKEVMRNHKARAWYRISLGKAVDWDKIFEGYQATVDWPGCAYYKELMEQYPEAKVLLTVRDPDSWYDSALETIYYGNKMPYWATFYINPSEERHILDTNNANLVVSTCILLLSFFFLAISTTCIEVL